MLRRWLILAAASLLTVTLPGFSQSPTADQLELLRSLSPEDREALLEQLGLGGVLGDDSRSTRDAKSRDAQAEEIGERQLTTETRALEKTLKP